MSKLDTLLGWRSGRGPSRPICGACSGRLGELAVSGCPTLNSRGKHVRLTQEIRVVLINSRIFDPRLVLIHHTFTNGVVIAIMQQHPPWL